MTTLFRLTQTDIEDAVKQYLSDYQMDVVRHQPLTCQWVVSAGYIQLEVAVDKEGV